MKSWRTEESLIVVRWRYDATTDQKRPRVAVCRWFSHVPDETEYREVSPRITMAPNSVFVESWPATID